MKRTKVILTVFALIYIFSILSLSSALTINSVSTSPDTIAPGETTDITISIKNNADDEVTDVSIALDLTNLPFAPSESGSEFSFDTIDSGKSKQAQFTLAAFNDAKARTYKIPVTLSSRDINNLVTTRSSVIGIMINSQPLMDVNIEDGLFLKGQNNQITVKVINKGLADVKFLEINAGTSSYYTLLSPSNVYVGDVDSNDFQTTEFKILFKENAPSSLTIPISLVYKDITNKEYVENKNVNLKVYTNQEAINLGLVKKSYASYYVLGIIFFILIFILYRILRRRTEE